MKKKKDSSHSVHTNLVSKGLASAKRRNHFSLSNAKQRLTGSRFRALNEKLYTSTSEENFVYYRDNPNLFEIYHEGYREQVSKWPFNPLTHVVEWLKSIDPQKVIGDFGCGEAVIAQTFTDRKVYSFDLVAGSSFVTACNMTKVPLKDDTLDVCIFCLSLMGKDWPLFVFEATRCLKEGGVLKIVEVKSRIKDLDEFDKFLASLGYKKEHDETPNASDFFIFYQFTLQKKSHVYGHRSDSAKSLLFPCPYKRR